MIHPYNVIIDPQGLYYFITDTNLKYFCRFTRRTQDLSPMLGIYDIDVYEFEFYFFNPNADKRVSESLDCRISKTIIDLVSSFFTSELRVIVFICDNADGRHEGRDLLFNKWHEEAKELFLRIPVTLDMQICEGLSQTIFGCVLVQHTFPFMNILKTELIDEADGIFIEKYT